MKGTDVRRENNNHKSFPYRLAACVLACGLTLSGCSLDPVPELDDDTRAEVAGYAVGMLMKYDTKHKSRFLSDAALRTELARLQMLADNKVNVEVYARRAKASKEKEEEEKKKALEETKTVDNSTGVSQNSSMYIEDFLSLDGFSFRYAGYELHPDFYPEGGEALYFSVPATEGKDIMVLNFIVTNNSGESKVLDMPSTNTSFIININGEKTRFAELSLLDNDLAMFNDTMAGGETRTLVLLAQVDEDLAANIVSVEVSMQSESKIATILMN